MTEPAYPAKPSPGDRVAVLSPAAGLPAVLPLPHELGVRRLARDFGLKPVEYPTTRRLDASARTAAAYRVRGFSFNSTLLPRECPTSLTSGAATQE